MNFFHGFRTVEIASLLFAAILASGCANLTSINRTTALPNESRAVHLDIKQRALIAKPKTEYEPAMVCAEPSPDALSAFASALSGGVSIPAQGAGSAAGALHEAAASIGLRTQSITLMRDSLYRLCEAYYNGQLTRPQVMLLMARSQDLTATVLAVEQLTGAVAASQAGLGGSAGGSSSATLLSNAKALAQARELEANATAQLNEAKQEVIATKAEKAQIEQTIQEKDTEISALTLESDAARKAELEEAKKALEANLSKLTSKLDGQQARVESLKANLDTLSEARAAMEQQHDSGISLASTDTGSSARFSNPVTRVTLTDASVEKIATSVDRIVTTVLTKQYIVETCLALLTKGRNDSSDDGIDTGTRIKCLDLIGSAAEREGTRAAIETKSLEQQLN